MTRSILPAAAVTVCVVHTAFAQEPRPVPVDRRLQAPAAFNTDHCVARIAVANAEARQLSRSSGGISVLIDNVHRLSVRALPQARRDVFYVTFAPHNSLCDGRTHRVDLTWNKDRSATYQVMFPRSGRSLPLSGR